MTESPGSSHLLLHDRDLFSAERPRLGKADPFVLVCGQHVVDDAAVEMNSTSMYFPQIAPCLPGGQCSTSDRRLRGRFALRQFAAVRKETDR